MPVIAVIGAQWGDEGKGKVVDLLAERADVVTRFSGGDNAGHTVINSFGEFKLHIVPSGIFSPRAICIIGNGVVVNPKALCQELDMIKQKGIDVSRLRISDRAHLVMPYHLLLDDVEEKSRGEKAIGTTHKGIGPAFVDKVARCGIRMGDLLNAQAFMEQLRFLVDQKNLILTRIYGADPVSAERIYDEYAEYGKRLAPYICETTELLDEALKTGKLVLLEGAQGTLLDPDFGTYPYCTSSSPIAGGASLGSGISLNRITRVLGVFKSYCTRVGSGPMPTELKDSTGDLIRERGREYGTTTGRPRRCGWFDTVVARFSHRINGFTGMALTRFDILDTLPVIKICTSYKVDGKTVDNFPACIATLEKCEPVYEELPGWQASTSNIRQFKDLPSAAKKYVERLEKLVGCPANLICVGPSREQTIEKSSVL
ncbi:MAG: adenylosuccinate synthase [Dehalococcoidales bacterium]|nr:adenylosuccinate synthase [Dehalococcoidales bacterium]